MTQEKLPKDKLPQKIQEALGRFERDNKKIGYACVSPSQPFCPPVSFANYNKSMHEHIVNREPGSYCKWCTGIVTETPVQAHRELYCGNTFSEYDWETINEEGIWVEGKGEDEGWKIYSKRTWLVLDGKGLYTRKEIKRMFRH